MGQLECQALCNSSRVAGSSATLPLWPLPHQLHVLPSGVRHLRPPTIPSKRFRPPSSGITWVHTAGKSAEKHLPETSGAGCAFLDFDNDGWMDIYLVNSGKADFYTPATARSATRSIATIATAPLPT